jgi:hypothetical protein
MRRIFILVALGLLFVPGLYAQGEFDHMQLGAYADYFRSNATGTNMFGVGGRFGISVFPHVKLEAEMAYDFNQVFTEGFENTGGGSIDFQNTGVRVLHGLFGPKVDLGHRSFRPFLELKGGFLNYSFDSRNADLAQFTSSVANLRAQNLNGVIMPGGGLEGMFGPVGLRLDVGDEMYFNNGAHHNLKVMFGPFFRF